MDMTGAILAGGLGTRMKDPQKGLLTVGGKRIIDRIMESMRGLFKEVIIVTRSPGLYRDFGVRLVPDVFEARSSLTGVHAAIHWSETSHVFVTACDIPFLSRDFVREIIGRVGEGDDVTITRNEQGRFQPLCAVYSKNCLEPVRENLEAGIFQIIRFFPRVRVREIPLAEIRGADPGLESFMNVNTPRELEDSRSRESRARS